LKWALYSIFSSLGKKINLLYSFLASNPNGRLIIVLFSASFKSNMLSR